MCESPAVAGMTDVVIGLPGGQGWVPAFAGMTVVGCLAWRGMTVVRESRRRGNDGCGDRVAGGSRLGSRLRGDDGCGVPRLAGNDGCARVPPSRE